MALFDNPPPPAPHYPKIIKSSRNWDLRYWWYRCTYHICPLFQNGYWQCIMCAFSNGGRGGSNGLTLGYYDDLQLNKTDLQFGFGTVFHFRFGGGWSTGARASGIDWLRLKIANIDSLEKLGILKLLINKFYQVLLKTKILVIFV